VGLGDNAMHTNISWYPDSTKSFDPRFVSDEVTEREKLTSFYNMGTCAQQASDALPSSLDNQYIMQGS